MEILIIETAMRRAVVITTEKLLENINANHR
jgi:hypothetical protein